MAIVTAVPYVGQEVKGEGHQVTLLTYKLQNNWQKTCTNIKAGGDVEILWILIDTQKTDSERYDINQQIDKTGSEISDTAEMNLSKTSSIISPLDSGIEDMDV